MIEGKAMLITILWVTTAVTGFLILWFVAGNWLAEFLFSHEIYIPLWLDVILLGPAGWVLLTLFEKVVFVIKTDDEEFYGEQ